LESYDLTIDHRIGRAIHTSIEHRERQAGAMDQRSMPTVAVSEIDCNRTSPRSFDDQKRQLVECSFYAVAAPLRFYTAKTRS
jgi:hypothetical protein